MIRIAHLSDLHVTDGPRLDDQREALDRCIDQIAACAPDLIAVTGDSSGHDAPHRTTPAERLVLFGALERLGTIAPIVYVNGNHDHEDDVAAFRHVATAPSYGPIVVVDKPVPFVVRGAGGKPIHVFPLPYFRRRAFLGVRGDPVPPTAEAVIAASNDALRTLFASWSARVRRIRAGGGVAIFLGHVQVRGCVLGSGEVLAGGEIEVDPGDLTSCGWDYAGIGHIHRRQRIGPTSWYVGSLWATTHSRAKDQAYGWHLVTVADEAPSLDLSAIQIPEVAGDVLESGAEGRTLIDLITCRPRRLVTLDYRYATVGDDPVPRWVNRPTPAQLADAAGAEVRPVLVVPSAYSAAVPWPDELARILEAGATRIHPAGIGEVVVEPVHRVRDGSDAVAQAPDDIPAQVRAYLGTLESPPNDADAAALFGVLGELLDDVDEVIDARTEAVAAGP